MEALLFAVLAGFVLIIGPYELITGRMPGAPAERRIWGYSWISTPLQVRILSAIAILVILVVLILWRPFSLLDLVLAAVGMLFGIAITISDSRARSRH